MNDRTFDQLLNAWMDLGPTSAPDRVADASRLEARSTRQTAIPPWWPPRRFPEMNNMVRVGLVAAAIVAAALLGFTYLIVPNVGGPVLFGEPSPTPEPTPEHAALITGSGYLEPGVYAIDQLPPMQITITVPPGWESLAVPAMVWSIDNDKATVGYMYITDLYADPCDTAQGTAGVGPTAGDLGQALANFPGISVDAQTDITISGYSGTRLDYTSTELACPDGQDAALMTAHPGPTEDSNHPGETAGINRWYILDVEGERLVIGASVHENAPHRLDDVEAIVESTTIDIP